MQVTALYSMVPVSDALPYHVRFLNARIRHLCLDGSTISVNISTAFKREKKLGMMGYGAFQVNL